MFYTCCLSVSKCAVVDHWSNASLMYAHFLSNVHHPLAALKLANANSTSIVSFIEDAVHQSSASTNQVSGTAAIGKLTAQSHLADAVDSFAAVSLSEKIFSKFQVQLPASFLLSRDTTVKDVASAISGAKTTAVVSQWVNQYVVNISIMMVNWINVVMNISVLFAPSLAVLPHVVYFVVIQ